jgi:hypothetical protein
MPEWWDGDERRDNTREKRTNDGDVGGVTGCTAMLGVALALVATLLWFLAGS